MDLVNPKPTTPDIQYAHLLNGYIQYIRDISSHRQVQFSHFMQIHLILLPAHIALISRSEASFSVIYSVLVAILGVTFCYVSYQRIRGNYGHMEIAYKELHKV